MSPLVQTFRPLWFRKGIRNNGPAAYQKLWFLPLEGVYLTLNETRSEESSPRRIGTATVCALLYVPPREMIVYWMVCGPADNSTRCGSVMVHSQGDLDVCFAAQPPM